MATKGDGIEIFNCRPSNGNDVRALGSEGKMSNNFAFYSCSFFLKIDMTGIISFIGYTSEEIVGDKDEEGRDGDGDDDYSEKENEGGE